MSGIVPEPPPSAEEHHYFQAIEAHFLRLRGKAVLLSSSDWQIAQGWYRAGVPLEVVLQVMEQLFERARDRKGRAISALRYFRAAVEAAWEEVEALSAGSRRDRLEPVRVAERLRRLTEALPADLSRRDDWVARIEALDGAVEVVEHRLSELDAELLAAGKESLPEAQRESILRQAADALGRLQGRLPAEEIERSRRHLEEQLVRRLLALPVLSIFAPQARNSGSDGS
ncbi:MAG: hypothetical protein AB7G12_09155 [Thermoanaerobaculia bacterium]